MAKHNYDHQNSRIDYFIRYAEKYGYTDNELIYSDGEWGSTYFFTKVIGLESRSSRTIEGGGR